MDKVLIRSVKRPGVTKLVAPVFADILCKIKAYERVDALPTVTPTMEAEKPRRRPRASDSPRRGYRRRDQTSEE